MTEEEKLTEIFGVKEVTEDSIMSEAKRIFKYQESVGNPYSMHVALEFATKELGKLKQRSEASPLETLVSGTDFERLKEILIETPELNMANYDHEDVRKLNDALIEIYEIIYSE